DLLLPTILLGPGISELEKHANTLASHPQPSTMIDKLRAELENRKINRIAILEPADGSAAIFCSLAEKYLQSHGMETTHHIFYDGLKDSHSAVQVIKKLFADKGRQPQALFIPDSPVRAKMLA